jgi:hypothetical protein
LGFDLLFVAGAKAMKVFCANGSGRAGVFSQKLNKKSPGKLRNRSICTRLSGTIDQKII